MEGIIHDLIKGHYLLLNDICEVSFCILRFKRHLVFSGFS